ncbi:hypothetical protein PY479_16410, partial [Shewanella sp. A32]|uniref:hypothetical protein n=1 Tax=Shewanella sp. A32 TaxID=3031327 RepID=UPI0023B89F61
SQYEPSSPLGECQSNSSNYVRDLALLGIPAAYAAKESSKHRELENHNRRAELELASLDPYLEKLPKETKDKVKEELTVKFFGLNQLHQMEEESVTIKDIINLLKTAIEKK